MASLNAMIHLGALVVFAALAWGLIYVQKQRDLLRLFVQPQQRAWRRLDWPWLFVRRLSGSLGLTWQHIGPKPKQQPQLLQVEVLADFIRQVTLAGCVLQVGEAGVDPLGGGVLTFQVRESVVLKAKSQEGLAQWCAGWSTQLTAALGMPTFVCLVEKASKAG